MRRILFLCFTKSVKSLARSAWVSYVICYNMSVFSSLTRDEVYLQNSDGERSGPFKCALSSSSKSATIFEDSLDIDEGGKLLRELPNGKVESFTVLEANFTTGMHAIPNHYALVLRKDNSLLKALPPTTTINIENSKGIQIGDNNIQDISSSVVNIITAIENSNFSEADKKCAKESVKNLLTNPTVASILGASVGSLLGML